MISFLSYSWKNSAERVALGKAISSNPNHSAIYDKKDIPIGHDIHRTISELLETCDCFIVVLTEESINSHEVRDELVRAHSLKKLIIPIVQSGIKMENLPWFIREQNQIRYDQEHFDRVIEDVEKTLASYTIKKEGNFSNFRQFILSETSHDPRAKALYDVNLSKANSLLSKSQYLFIMVGYTCCLKTTISRRISKLLKIPLIETSCLDKAVKETKKGRWGQVYV